MDEVKHEGVTNYSYCNGCLEQSSQKPASKITASRPSNVTGIGHNFSVYLAVCSKCCESR